eukprot:TRINITY_DN8353_c0_g1_i1.p1 TRINITY_DN8353_c0_g1~~TRINITY_DN8353_c0_g1_i1.p1  ORF type:complete len:595 (+),score=109.48 TRINITY_DN8353_c0_g1_i1:35-1786(+)
MNSFCLMASKLDDLLANWKIVTFPVSIVSLLVRTVTRIKEKEPRNPPLQRLWNLGRDLYQFQLETQHSKRISERRLHSEGAIEEVHHTQVVQSLQEVFARSIQDVAFVMTSKPLSDMRDDQVQKTKNLILQSMHTRDLLTRWVCLIGMRHIGKTDHMRRICKMLIDEGHIKDSELMMIDCINFALNEHQLEDVILAAARDSKRVICFDEIQSIKNWAHKIYSAQLDLETHHLVFLIAGSTGRNEFESDSRFLDRRHLVEVHPMSFQESLKFLQWCGISTTDEDHVWNTYLMGGGLPRVYSEAREDNLRDAICSAHTILFRDMQIIGCPEFEDDLLPIYAIMVRHGWITSPNKIHVTSKARGVHLPPPQENLLEPLFNHGLIHILREANATPNNQMRRLYFRDLGLLIAACRYMGEAIDPCRVFETVLLTYLYQVYYFCPITVSPNLTFTINSSIGYHVLESGSFQSWKKAVQQIAKYMSQRSRMVPVPHYLVFDAQFPNVASVCTLRDVLKGLTRTKLPISYAIHRYTTITQKSRDYSSCISSDGVARRFFEFLCNLKLVPFLEEWFFDAKDVPWTIPIPALL